MVGHVDHGKTTLTEMLSGKWTDTHSEEMKRGISIRLGYADMTVYKCPKCKPPHDLSTTNKCIKCFSETEPVRTVSFVDAPGHEMLMATVLSGASLMDGALLLIAANEKCPQPQTEEHLKALDIVGIENIVIVQSKIDLVSKEEAMENQKQIKEFVKGTVAENSPIIPVSAKKRVNIDILIKSIQENIPTPRRDPAKDPKFLIARSFDTNRPGVEMGKLRGGVIGGSLMRGKLRVGDEIEIKPGVKIKDEIKPVKTKITGLQKAGKSLKEINPGGLIGMSTSLDPYLTKSDSLSGSVAGITGKLPGVLKNITLKTTLMKRVVGTKESTEMGEIKTGDPLMLTLGTMKTSGAVTSARDKEIEVSLKTPLCAEKGERIVISKLFSGRWRLIGYGELV